MENFFEREVKRLGFVEERMKIREQEKRQLDAEESKRQQVSRPRSQSRSAFHLYGEKKLLFRCGIKWNGSFH